MIGLSLQPGVLDNALSNPSAEKMLAAFGGRSALLQCLRQAGAGAVELRTLRRDTPDDAVERIFRLLKDAGFQVTVHGAMTAPDQAVAEVFSPLARVLREKLTVTLHPLPDPDDTLQALTRLSDHALALGADVTFALENNRLMPDKTPGDACPLVLSLVKRLDRPNVGICWDMGHYWYNVVEYLGGNSSLLPTPEFLSRVVHTHIHGLSGGTTHFPPTPSSLPLPAWCAALPSPGVYNIELDPGRFPPDTDWKAALLSSIQNVREAVPPAADRLWDMGLHLAAWWDRALSQTGADSFCLTGPTGYVFHTDGMLWAVDPCLRHDWAARLAEKTICQGRHRLQYILYTHGHEDHLDPLALTLLQESGAVMVVPDFLELPQVPFHQVLRVKAGQSYRLQSLTLTPFESLHRRPDTGKGPREFGYCIQTKEKRLLLPGDIRDYSPEKLPAFPCDWLFAHLWLGDENALNLPCAPYADQFAAFAAGLRPRNIALTHLYETGRDASSIWTCVHAGLAADAIYRRNPNIQATLPRPGVIYSL